MTPIDQAFFEFYKSKCPNFDDKKIIDFLNDEDCVIGWRYSHLMDSYISFCAGIKYKEQPNDNDGEEMISTVKWINAEIEKLNEGNKK
jgi:hypothetical protein